MSTQWIHRTKLLANPLQPPARGIVPPDVAEYLGKSILNHGFEQLPLVRPHGIDFQVADGHQRVFGAIPWILATEEYEVQEGDKKSVVKITAEDKARFETIECVVREMSDQEMLDCVIESNMKRRDLTPMDEAWAFSTYIEKFGVTQAAFAEKHGMSQGQVGNTIRLLALPEPIQQKLISCEINEGQARQLLRLNAEPAMQAKFAEDTIKQGYTVNALDQRINQDVWYHTQILHSGSYNSPHFDTAACAECPHRIMANEPYGNSKKEARCFDKDCWQKKEDQAIKDAIALAQKEADKAGKKGTKGKGPKIFTSKDLQWGKYEDLSEYRLNELDDPSECKTCIKTALFKYDLTDKQEPKRVCVDLACFRRKKTKHTRDEHKSQKEKDLALTMQIGKALEHVAKNPHNCLVVLAHYVLGKANGEQTGLDLLKMFETLPKTLNGRLDLNPLLASLEDRSMDELLQLTVAGAITLQRRDVYGYSQMGYGTKLSAALKRQIAFLTGTMSQHRKAIVAWRKDNCDGCRHNFQPAMMTKPDEKNCNMGTEYDIDARCPSRYIEKEKEKPAVEAAVQTLIDIPAKGTPPAGAAAEELKPAKPKYTVKKVGNSHIAIDDDNRVIAIEVTKAAAADQAEASFLPVATAAVSGMKNYVLNHTYRFSLKHGVRSNFGNADVLAQDLPAAIDGVGVKPADVTGVKVWKSSGKIGTGGSVSSGWSKCTEPMEKPKEAVAVGADDANVDKA